MSLSIDLVDNSQVTSTAVLMAKIHSLAKLVRTAMKAVLYRAFEPECYDGSTGWRPLHAVS